MKFRLLKGIHNHGGQTYHPGEVVESEIDLAGRFNIPDGPDRFAPVEGVVDNPSDNPDAMSVKELKEFAAMEEIDVEGLEKKADLLKRVKGVLAES